MLTEHQPSPHPQDHNVSTLEELKIQIDLLRQESPDRPNLTHLPSCIAEIVEDSTIIPDFVITTQGVCTFSAEQRTKLAEQLKGMSPDDPAFWSTADGILKNALAYEEMQRKKNEEDLARIKKEKDLLRVRYIETGRAGYLDNEARRYLDQDYYQKFGNALIWAIAETPNYKEAGEYLKRVAQSGHNLTTLLEDYGPTNPPDGKKLEEILMSTKLLLQPSDPLPSNERLLAENIIPAEYARSLTVLTELLVRRPNLAPSKWMQFRDLLEKSVKLALSPEATIASLVQIESRGSFTREGQALTSPDHAFLSQIRNVMEEIQQVYTLADVSNRINRHISLDRHERLYLRLAAMEYAAKKGICSPTFAYEAVHDNEILTKNRVETIINSLLTIAEPEKSGTKPVNKKLKFISTIIVGAIIGAAVSQIPPAAYQDLAQKTIQNIEQISQAIQSTLVSQLPKIDIVKIEKVKQPPPRPTPRPTPTKVETIKTGENKPLPNRIYEGSGISKDQLHWNADQSRAGSGFHTAESGISPEGFLRQATEIAWQMENRGGTSNYLINQFASIYDPNSNRFIESDPAYDQTMMWEEVSQDSSTSTVRLFAKRTYLPNYIALPKSWGYYVDSARVKIYDKKTGTTKEIPVRIGTSTRQEQILNLVGVDSYIFTEDQEILLDVGLSEGELKNFNPDFLYSDQDAKFPDKTVFPQELLHLIDRLNQSQTLSDIEKLESLRDWFRSNFMYSMDPVYKEYYMRGNPSSETYYRRLFGTGNLESDPNYLDNPALTRKVVCEAANSAFATAARELDLFDGQVILAGGYINTGFFGRQQEQTVNLDGKTNSWINTITNGELHAWAVYLSRDGQYHNLDATPPNVDPYTQQVLGNARQNLGFRGADVKEKEFRSESPLPDSETGAKIKASRNNNIISLLVTRPIPERLQDIFNIEGQPLNSWRIKHSGNEEIYGSNFLNLEVANTLGVDIIGTLSSVAWKSWAEKEGWDYPYDMGFPYPQRLEAYLEKSSPEFKKTHPQPEDIASEISGLVTLTGNAIVLPNLGQISPRSISANLITKDEKGTITKQPLPLSRVVIHARQPSTYALVFAQSADELEGKTVELRYKTTSLNQWSEVPFLKLDHNEAKYYFEEVIPRESLGMEFKKFLDALDEAKTYGDLLRKLPGYYPKTHLQGYFQEEAERREFIDQGYINELKMPLDKDDYKVLLISDYIETHFQTTWNGQWNEFYRRSNPSDQEYWEKITKYKRIDPETAATLFIAAARTLKSQQGDFNIPLVPHIVYVDLGVPAGSYRYFQGSGNIPDEYSLFTPSEKLVEPQLLRFGGPTTDSGGSTIYDPFFLDRYFLVPAQLDPLSADAASQTVTQLYSPDELATDDNSENARFVLDHQLPTDQRLKLSFEEWAQLRYLNWINYEPWQLEVAIGILLGATYAIQTKNKASWWKNIDAKQFKGVLDETAVAWGITPNHPVYAYLQDFYTQVLTRKSTRIPVVRALRNAGRMKQFEASRKRRGEESSELLFHPEKIYLNWSGAPLNYRTGFEQFIRSSRYSNRIRSLALGKGQGYGYDTITMMLARKLMHNVFHQPYIQEATTGRIETLANFVTDALVGLHAGYYLNDNSPKSWVRRIKNLINTPEIREQVLETPDQFTKIIQSNFERWALLQISHELGGFTTKIDQILIKKGISKPANKSRELDYEKARAEVIKQEIPPEMYEKIQRVETIISEALLPYCAMIEEETQLITKMQHERAAEKRKWKRSKPPVRELA